MRICKNFLPLRKVYRSFGAENRIKLSPKAIFSLTVIFVLGILLSQSAEGWCWSDIPEDPQGKFLSGHSQGLSWEEFKGNRIILPEVSSQRIQDIHLKIVLPAQCTFLPGKSRLQLFAKKERPIASFKVSKLDSSFRLNKKISSDSLYAQINVFYCREESSAALCLMKHLLFKIPLKQSADSKPVDIILEYKIGEDSL